MISGALSLLTFLDYSYGRLAPNRAEVTAACYFAYALRLDMPGSNHHTIRGADFQRKVWDFYTGVPAAAPLEESFWVLSLPSQFQEVISTECPALLILSYMVVAEVKLYIDPSSSREYWEIALQIADKLAPDLFALVTESWPLREATTRLSTVAARVASLSKAQAVENDPRVLDIAVAHCKEDLGWIVKALRRWALPGRTRLFIYEKCGVKFDLQAFDEEGAPIPTSTVLVDDDGPGGRKDECSAYLTHLLQVVESGDVARYTMFWQSDALQHVQIHLLDQVMRALRYGTIDLPFLHLGRARMVASNTPCKRAIYEQVMGKAQTAMQISYCCSHFMVRRDTVLARGASAWRQTLSAMDLLPAIGCETVRPGAGMHCLTFEAMWHVMFGMPDQLSPRSVDVSLPIFLRTPEMDYTDLPNGANSTMYFTEATGDPDLLAWIDEMQTRLPDDVTGARSIGYLTLEE